MKGAYFRWMGGGGKQEKLGVTSFEGMESSQQDIKHLETVFEPNLS